MKMNIKSISIIIILLILIITGSILIFAKYKKDKSLDNNLTLEVKTKLWGSWGNEIKDTLVSYNLHSLDTDTIFLDGIIKDEKKKLTIKNYDNNSIKLNVENLSLKQGKDLEIRTINLNACKTQDFTMKRGEKVELNTCSTDMGITYEILYK